MDVWVYRIVAAALALVAVGGVYFEGYCAIHGLVVPTALHTTWPIAFGILVGVPILPSKQSPDHQDH